MSKIAAIVGRPNVGKSTLFNRLVGARKAIVDDHSGVTRDRHYGKGEWRNRGFVVIDTGGYVPNSSDVFESAIRDQVKIAIEESDILLFMVDVTTGITDLDLAFADILRKSHKPVFLIVNKIDNNDRVIEAAEFYSMGFDPLFHVSSLSGSGTGEILDEMYDVLELEKEEPVLESPNDDDESEDDSVFPKRSDVPKVAIVGRPNVGKSSLVNALLGFERNIVTPIAGTTRDTIHTHYKAFGNEMLLVDTAGIRKKAKVHENIEFYSVLRAIKAIEECDVCVIMVDATQGVESQDLNLFNLAMKNNKGIMLLINKWDLVENKETNTMKFFEEAIRAKTAPFVDYPIMFISVIEKQRIFKAVEGIQAVYDNMRRTVSTSKLNEFILPIIEQTPPPSEKGKYVRIKYVTQLKANAVVFAFFCNLPQYVKESYKRFLENKLRQEYNFQGVPIKLFFRKK
jgi:GTP-binding protein